MSDDMPTRPIPRLYSIARPIGGGSVNDDFHEAPHDPAAKMDRPVWALHELQRALPILRGIEGKVPDLAAKVAIADLVRRFDRVSRGLVP